MLSDCTFLFIAIQENRCGKEEGWAEWCEAEIWSQYSRPFKKMSAITTWSSVYDNLKDIQLPFCSSNILDNWAFGIRVEVTMRAQLMMISLTPWYDLWTLSHLHACQCPTYNINIRNLINTFYFCISNKQKFSDIYPSVHSWQWLKINVHWKSIIVICKIIFMI